MSSLFTIYFRNASTQSLQKLQELSRDPVYKMEEVCDSQETSASLDLLLRFQRLLVSKLFPKDEEHEKAMTTEPGQ